MTTELRTMTREMPATEGSDSDLLRQFVGQGDEWAFGALLRRHGPLVLALCRRLLRHEQDAEDVFQATFLVLARKAATLSRPELLGNWLYGVAYRIALKARAEAARRRQQERQAPAMHEGGADARAAWLEVREILDEELARLPAKYRAPLVLCDLEGNTHEEAARRLGHPPGSMSWLLARARERLRRRLSGRGISPAALTALAPLLGLLGGGPVPACLMETTARGAAAYASGAPVLGMVSAWALRLARQGPRRGGLLVILLWALLAGSTLAATIALLPAVSLARPAAPAKAVMPPYGGSAAGPAGCTTYPAFRYP